MALTYKNKPVGLVRCNDEYFAEIKCNNDIILGTTPDEYFVFSDSYDDDGQVCYSVAAKNVEDMPEFVYIPNTHNGLKVRYIADSGFQNCKKIKTLVIPNNVKTIMSEALRNCDNLISVALLKDSGLKNIGDEAFRGCYALKFINLETAEHLERIGEFAFANCGFESIFIPEGVTRIEKSAFRWCDNLTSVIMPDTISYIGNRAFSCCYRLEEIFLSEKVEEIGYGAFAHCHSLTIYCEQEDKPKGWKAGWNISLRPIEWGVGGVFEYTLLDDDTYEVTVNHKSHLPDKVVIPNAYNGKPVTRIGEKAFYQWGELNNRHPYDNIDSVVIPDGITTIGDEAFRACRNLKSVIISNTVTSIGKRAFQDCRNLTSIAIPNSVTEIDSRAFQGCKNLTSITIPDSVTTMGAWIFTGCNKITIYCETTKELPEGYDWDYWWNGSNIFARCKTEYLVEEDCKTVVNNLTILKYKNGTAKIIGYDDESATNMIIEIPSSVGSYQITSIGDYAFKECKMLQKITFAADSQLTHIGNYAFYGCSNLTNISVPSSVTKISDSAFENCNRLQNVTFGESSQLTHIGNQAFFDCSVLTGITIPNDVAYIGEYAFNGCKSFSTIAIPSNVVLVGDGAFMNCNQLSRVTFGTNSKLAFIADRMFANCSSLTSITIPNNISGIGSNAFYSCSKLTSITIPANVISIGVYAFKDCTNLISVTFADIENSKLQSIGYEAFAGCNISEITLPNGLEPNNTSPDAFDKDVEINGGVNGNALVDLTTGTLLTAFNSTTITNIISNIGERAFSGITGIMNLIIPENITTIATEAFLNCLGLREIFIPTSVKYMQANAFKGCTGLTIKCAARKQPDTWDDDWNPDNLPVEWGCYEKTASDELFIYELLSDNTYSIKAKNKDSLSGRIVIPASYQGIPVTKIATNGFSGANISWVDVLSGIKTIEYGAFKNCSILLDINFPETLEYIGADAFYGCENLTLIQLPNSIKTIESWAFRDCDKAKTIYIPNGVEMINNGAFIGVNVDGRTIWCENTEAEVSAKGWDAAWNAKDITGIGKFPVTYNAAAITDSSKFEFRTTMDGNYYVKPASTSIAEDMVVVHIPSSYNGIPVTEIGSFGDCKNLVKMILPDSITKLRVEAFGGDRDEGTTGCTNLNEINLPNSLKWIGDGAFLGSSITKLVIPEGVEQSTLSNVFMNCQQLRHITLPESWTEIGEEMFKGCTNLTDIVLPNKCTYIGSNAFLNCENLQNVYLYNKHWQVGSTVLDLTDKSATEVAQLLTSPEYRGLSWSVVKANAPVLHSELDEHFVDFTVENPNNTPQVLTISLTLKDGSADSIEEAYCYSETYTIGANQSITEIFDMPPTENCSGLMAFSYVELVAYFENSDETKLILTNNNEICEQNGHSYIDTVIAPTCTTRGYTRHECKVCGQSYDDSYVEVTKHTCTSNTITPTCTTSGYTEYTCSTCGHYYIDNYVAALGHTEVIDLAVPATCTTSGMTAGSHCSVCGKIIVPQALIPALGHTWVDATCTEPKTCSRCGETEGVALGHTWIAATCEKPRTCSVCGTTEGEPLGHSYGAWLTTVAPTCTKFGEMQRTCSRCGDVDIAPIEPLGHNWVDATCTEPKTCSRCGETIGEALGHDWGEWISNDDRTHSRICRNDTTHIETELCSYSKVVTPPTCTEQGYTTYTCTVCGHVYVGDYTAKLGHSYVETVTPPTCTEDGYSTYTCSVCGHSYVADPVFALGHISSDWIIDARPTGLTAGSKHKECTRCGEILETATIPKLENADEYLTYTLLDSGEEYSVKATYLDYLPNELTIPSTFNGKPVAVVEFEAFAGYRESNSVKVALTKVVLPDSIEAILPSAFDGCTRLTEINIPMGVEYIGEDAFDDCNNLIIYCEASSEPDTWDENWNSSNCNVVWGALCENGHTYGEWVTITQPTCTVVGLRRKTCAHCGDKVDEEIPALGHEWGDWKDVHPATCEIDGTQERTCSRCGETEYRTIPATGHDWDIDVEVVEPTCTDGGYTIHTCNACGHTYRDNYTDPLGHISSDWIIDVEPTTETEGSKHKECTRCGVVLETAVIERLPSEDTVNYLTNREGSYLSDNNGNLLIVGNVEATYLIDEDGNHITDEQGNLFIL